MKGSAIASCRDTGQTGGSANCAALLLCVPGLNSTIRASSVRPACLQRLRDRGDTGLRSWLHCSCKPSRSLRTDAVSCA